MLVDSAGSPNRVAHRRQSLREFVVANNEHLTGDELRPGPWYDQQRVLGGGEDRRRRELTLRPSPSRKSAARGGDLEPIDVRWAWADRVPSSLHIDRLAVAGFIDAAADGDGLAVDAVVDGDGIDANGSPLQILGRSRRAITAGDRLTSANSPAKLRGRPDMSSSPFASQCTSPSSVRT